MTLQRKDEIITVAKDLFNTYGFHNVSMRQISQTLNISVGNLTYYFPRKADILAAIIKTLPSPSNLRSIEDPSDLNAFFLILLHTIEDNRFLFNDPLILEENPDSYAVNKANIAFIYDHMKHGLATLRDKHFFNEKLSDPTIDALVNMILLAHLSWCNPTINGEINPKVDEQQFLQMHWALFNGYHNMEKRQAFHSENRIDD